MRTPLRATFSSDIEKTFSACLSSIAILGYSVTNSDKDSGIISFKTARSMFSYGGTLTCTLIKMGDERTDLIINNLLANHNIYDWGLGKKIAQKVIDEVSQNLN